MAGCYNFYSVRSFLLASLVVASSCMPPVWAERNGPLGSAPNFTSIQIPNEQSVGEVRGITQDHKGFIWVVGRLGVARYDGYRFHAYDNDDVDHITNAYLTDIFVDRDNQLWITSASNGVGKLNRQKDRFEHYRYQESTNNNIATTNSYKKIYQDEHGDLWFVGAGGATLYDRRRDELQRFIQQSALSRENASDMIQVDEDEYLFATDNGVFLWNRTSNALEHFVPIPGDDTSLADLTVRAFTKDQAGRIWVGHAKGLCRYDHQTKTFQRFELKNKVKERKLASVWAMTTSDEGHLWLGTNGNGLMYFDPHSHAYGSYLQNSQPASLGTEAVPSIYEDRLGDLWVGGFPASLFHYDQTNNFVTLHSNFIRSANGLFKNHTWAFAEDAERNLWLGLESFGLAYYDRAAQTVTQSYHGVDFSKVGLPHSVLSLLLDEQNNLWAGSWVQGVSKINLDTMEYTHYRPETVLGDRFGGDSVWSIVQISTGNILFGTMDDGLIRYNPETDSFTHWTTSTTPALSSNTVWSIMEDRDGRWWIATDNGINVYNPTTQTIKYYFHSAENEKTVSSDRILSFLQDSKGRIWVATQGGGVNLFDAQRDSFTQISTQNGLASNDVETIVEDVRGTLWISTAEGISSLDPETFAITNFSKLNWLQEGEFSRGSSLRLADGRLAFGGVKGFNIIAPDRVEKNNDIPPVYLTELTVLNTPIHADDNSAILKKDIVEAEHITLEHNHSMMSLAFTALSYRGYNDNQYRYRLQGLDDAWRNPTESNKAIYTRLAPGDYEFWIASANNSGVWGDEIKLVDITILPPLWRSWWAYLAYLAIIGSLIYWYVSAQKRKVAQTRAMNTKLIELDKLKDDFLANTSHELKTPLNGILGIAQTMQSSTREEYLESRHKNVSLILSSARRLERLINNLLDFSKSKTSKIKLEKSCEDIGDIVKGIVEQIQLEHSKPSVIIDNNMHDDVPLAYCDALRTQQIFYNVISNAVKYTEQGSVTLTSTATDQFIEVKISDTGIGIAQSDIPKLYDSFSQLSESGTETKNGTGLSLAMTKYFVDLQGGQLSVDSKLGEGTTFSVYLPRAQSHQIEHHHTNIQSEVLALSPQTQNRPAASNQPLNLTNGSAKQAQSPKLPVFLPQNRTHADKAPLILVVDDESINRMVIREMLVRSGYAVCEISNGKELVDLIESGFRCDLILLDIMMPKLSGTDACKALREQYSPQELPIIFISAKSQSNVVVECFQINGNDFLSKPVNREELLARVQAQLKISKDFRDLKKSTFSRA